MSLVTITESGDEPVDVIVAAKHLRETDSAHNEEIARLISVAREYCERKTNRTLRVNVVRRLTLDSWPAWNSRDGCHLKLPWPPLVSTEDNPVEITYLDAEGNEQTVDEADYHVELSTDGFGRLIFLASFTSPTLEDVPAAVTVQFTTGYGSTDAIPKTAVQAILTKLTELWGSGTENEIKAAALCTERLLNTVDATGYA